MRYFYRIGYFKSSDEEVRRSKHNWKVDGEIVEALKEGNRLKVGILLNSKYQQTRKEIPKVFNHWESDIRTWTHSNCFKELDEKSFKEISKLEKNIMKNEGVILAKLKGWHCPVKIKDDEYEKSLMNKFDIDDIKICLL